MHTIKPQVYKQKSLTFIVSEDRVIIKTPLEQTFYLEPRAHYFNRRLRLIRTLIELGEIRDFNELSTWCGVGVEWITTSQEYTNNEVDNLALA